MSLSRGAFVVSVAVMLLAGGAEKVIPKADFNVSCGECVESRTWCVSKILEQPLQTCLAPSLSNEECDKKKTGNCDGLSDEEKRSVPPEVGKLNLPEKCDDCVKNKDLTWCHSKYHGRVMNDCIPKRYADILCQHGKTYDDCTLLKVADCGLRMPFLNLEDECDGCVESGGLWCIRKLFGENLRICILPDAADETCAEGRALSSCLGLSEEEKRVSKPALPKSCEDCVKSEKKAEWCIHTDTGRFTKICILQTMSASCCHGGQSYRNCDRLSSLDKLGSKTYRSRRVVNTPTSSAPGFLPHYHAITGLLLGVLLLR